MNQKKLIEYLTIIIVGVIAGVGISAACFATSSKDLLHLKILLIVGAIGGILLFIGWCAMFGEVKIVKNNINSRFTGAIMVFAGLFTIFSLAPLAMTFL